MIKSEQFIRAMNSNCKMMDAVVVVDGISYSSDNILSVNPHFEGSLLCSVMRCCDIEIQFDEQIDSTIATALKGTIVSSVRIGAKEEDNKDFAYIEYGKYKVYSAEYREESNSVFLTCYDSMLDAMIPYNIEVEEDMTVKSLLSLICETLGWQLADVSFANEDVIIEARNINTYLPTVISDETYYKKVSDLGKGLTYRDMLDDISEIIGGNLIFKNDGLLYPVYPEEAIYNDQLVKLSVDNQQSISFEKVYGPINSVAIVDENSNAVFINDDESVVLNGKCKITISDNFLIDSNQNAFIEAIFAKLKNLSYVPFEFTAFGFGYMEFGDVFELEDKKGNINNTLFLSDSFLVSLTVSETASAKAYSAGSETEYSTSSASDRIISKKLDDANEAITATKNAIDAAISEMETNYTTIIQNSEEIILEAVKEYVKTSDYEEFKETVSAQLQIVSDSIVMNFNSIEELITENNGEIYRQLTEISKYIRFVDGSIILGEVENPMETAVENGKFVIRLNGQEIAYMSDNNFYITNAEILTKIIIGDFAFVPRSNGNLSFKKIR